MTQVVVIRPEPGCSATVSAGRAASLAMVGMPLFEVVPCEWNGPDPDEIDGLLIGSANAIRHSGKEIERYITKPVHCVGAATAESDAAAGFAVASTGTGGLQAVLDDLPPGPQRLLRIAGEDHVPLDPPAEVKILARVAYRVDELEMTAELAQLLGHDALVLLHSASAARHFARECNRLSLDRSKISLAALGPRIAIAAGEGWQGVRSAPQPTDTALLALARDMCH